MANWQKLIIVIWGVSSFILFVKGFKESKDNKNSYGITPYLLPWGVFVWGDAVVFGLFWTLVSFAVLFLKDWILFLLIISVFWVIRSLGETIYWFNQQYSNINRNPPEKFWFYKYFHNDSVWFIHQIAWQCITVASIIFTIYFAHSWLNSL